jgi:hypothetical protein
MTLMRLSASAEGTRPEHLHIAETCIDLLVKQDHLCNDADSPTPLNYSPFKNERFTGLQNTSTIYVPVDIKNTKGVTDLEPSHGRHWINLLHHVHHSGSNAIREKSVPQLPAT